MVWLVCSQSGSRIIHLVIKNIPSRRLVSLLRMDHDKNVLTENLRLINSEVLKHLAKELAKIMALVSSIVSDAQICMKSGWLIHDNLHCMRYIVERDKSLINLRQSNTFDTVAAIPKIVSSGPIYREWITRMYSGSCSINRVKSYLLEHLSIKCSVYNVWLLFLLLYVLALESYLQKLEN